MFSVESAVRQVKPDFILQHVLEAEEGQWTKVHLDGEDLESSLSHHSSPSSVSSDCGDPGVVLLRHGTSIKKIHKYFSQLEFRKCCLHLAGRKSTFQSLRVVLSSANLDDGSTIRRRTANFVTHLEDKELRAFKHAYLCAAYPVLAAPDPPSPFSPSPVNPFRVQRAADSQKATNRAITPYSAHDSGLEESEDLAFVPSESICAHLQHAFHLSNEKFRDYRYLINKTYIKKSAQKLLAEVLAGQLAVLENNCHPFYRPQDFIQPNGYDIWRKAERNHITELLGKFWHHSLPFPCNSQDLIAELHGVHDDYHVLLRKLLAYEHEFQNQTEEEGGSVSSFLSSTSVRLLKEFGLRYGVGEQYRRILYIEQMSIEFSPSLWYLRHMLSMLNRISEMLPANKHTLSMVKREHEMLQSSLVRLATQSSKALDQMKSLFPGNKPAGAIEMLITMLQRLRDIRLYLTSPVQEPPPLPMVLKDIVQGTFFQTYEKCKTVIRTELKQSRDIRVCPRLLNALIMEMRDEVLDYKNNFEATFRQYFDITVMAAKAFYALLMKDVDLLCQQEKWRDNAIDLRMLALIHRLNQLDRDWNAYITVRDQTWRHSFQVHVEGWGCALRMHVEDLMLEIVAGDGFVTQQMHVPTEGSFRSTSSSSSSQPRSVSITPSLNSAFSSISSTPRQGSSLSNRNMNAEPDRTATAALDNRDEGHGTSQQGEDFLTFADKRRQCASLPVFADRPAMVRAMSDLQVPGDSHNGTGGLRATSALPDLRSGNDGSFSGPLVRGAGTASKDKSTKADLGARKGSSGHGLSQREKESHILDCVNVCEEMEDGTVTPTAEEDEELSDDDNDKDFAFPPIQEVTDLNISEPNVSSSYDLKQDSIFTGMSPSNGAKSTFVVGASSYPSRGSGFEDPSFTKSRTKSQREPPQRQPQPSSAFQIHQSSPFRKISTGSSSGSPPERENQFLQSIHSTVSFPSPTHCREVVIPVSGSVIDVVIVLRRTLGFAQSLFGTIFPQQRHDSSESGDGMERVMTAFLSMLHSCEGKAYLNIVEVLCQGLSVYADNMLCLDLCAVPKDVACRVIGTMLVEHAVHQQKAEKIWGCRHQLEGLQNCFVFHNRNATFLCDRYEPITQKMCVRINNVMACQHYLDWCSKETQSPNLHHPPSKSKYSSATADPTCSSSPDSTRPMDDTVETEDSDGDIDDINNSKQQLYERTRTHLKAIWNALCRLLAFRINLFLRDGMNVLLSLKPSNVAIEAALLPVTSFLRSHFDALSTWLYSSSFRRVIEFLWIYIVQDIENEACKLGKQKNTKLTPQILLQTLSHLMKFMNNCERGITRELMLSQAEDVMTKLHLLTLKTLNLIALYYHLEDMWSHGNHRDSTDEAPRPVRLSALALHQLHHDLQTRRKCFSGAQLVFWIVRHSDLFMSPDELSLCRGKVVMSIQGAEDIAQQLQDHQYILDIERENSPYSWRNSASPTPQYPEVSIHSQRGTRAESGGDHDPDSDDSTSIDNDVTPTPTPHPSGVRSSGSQQKVVAEVHATPVDNGASVEALYHAMHGSSNNSEGHSNVEPTPVSRHTSIMTDNIAKSETVTRPVVKEGTTQQATAPQLNLPTESMQQKSSVNDPARTVLSVMEECDANPKAAVLRAAESEVVVGVVGQVTAALKPIGYLGLPAEVKKISDSPSDFEDSGVGEAHESSMSDTNESSLPAEISAKMDETAPASQSSGGFAEEDHPTPCASESNTPLAQSPAHMPTPGQENQESPVYEADHSACTTPSSMRSLMRLSTTSQFENSHKRFYFMPASNLLPRRDRSHQPSGQLLTGVLSYLNHSLTILKNSQETNTLAEKCFNLKIQPVSILGIVHGRRRTDTVAQSFLYELPAQLLEEVRSNIKTQAAECSVL